MTDPHLYEQINQDLKNYYDNEKNNKRNLWRNNFHIEMPFGLINDPNGLCYYNNKFYIFYQWNPFSCEHKFKHWGLVTTTDFVNFTRPEIVLRPEEWFDKDGCYSGGAHVKDDTLQLFYTGNVKGESGQRESYQCMVEYKKDGTFYKKGVIIDKQPESYTAHFRDPMVYEGNGIYYMVLGAQTEDLKGRALIYKSEDSYKWSFAGELKTNMNNFGYMWECPNLFKISGNQFAFLFSPQGLKEEEFKYQNKFQSGYVIGELDLNDVSLEHHTEFKEIDKGFDFYAPQVFRYKEKHIMLGWIGMPDNEGEYVSSQDGWIFGLTMPRVLKYIDGVIYQEPLEFLENLRESQIVDLENEIADNYKITLETRTIECNLDLDMKDYNDLELKLKFKKESISIFYNKEEEICILDRNSMELGGKGVRKFELKADKSLKLQMFIDNSTIEIYYQDGLETTTFAYFPKCDDFEIEIKNKAKINKLQIWNLRKINYV